ncbi:MAG: DoxX family protein [Streptosporangiales bacterium]|nr:DoxX family protein [Streptosporangiales bacterium]
MFTAFVVVTVLTTAANTSAATVDFIRSEWLLVNMTKTGVPHSWLFPLGALKVAGALGLLAGIGVPLIGVAASVGLVLFFVGAIVTVMRGHAYSLIPYPASFLLLAVGSLVLRLALPDRVGRARPRPGSRAGTPRGAQPATTALCTG